MDEETPETFALTHGRGLKPATARLICRAECSPSRMGVD